MHQRAAFELQVRQRNACCTWRMMKGSCEGWLATIAAICSAAARLVAGDDPAAAHALSM